MAPNEDAAKKSMGLWNYIQILGQKKQGWLFKKDNTELYSIATLNSNGYAREKAIKKLAESKNEKAIQFIVYRLADWVQGVRQTALKNLENFKKTEFINALVDNLTIFEWLQKVERTDLSLVYTDIMNFVVVEN